MATWRRLGMVGFAWVFLLLGCDAHAAEIGAAPPETRRRVLESALGRAVDLGPGGATFLLPPQA